ncbi:MAG: hypothetical protein OK439_04165, partial [Thaumarchaeota archaeon]|nr:hypothetical protein [Nitrososphaerota archaeon]
MDFLHYSFGLSFGYQPLLPFALIVVILLVRPTGLAPNAQTGITLLRKLRPSRKQNSVTTFDNRVKPEK